MSTLIVNPESLIGDFLGTVPAMQAIATARGPVDLPIDHAAEKIIAHVRAQFWLPPFKSDPRSQAGV